MTSFRASRFYPALVLWALAISAAGQGPAAAPSAVHEPYAAAVRQVSAAPSNEERRKAVEAELRKIGVDFTLQEFTATSRAGREVKGTNVIAELPNAKAKRTIMLGAHFDRVSAGTGSIDNASGTAAVLELLRAFKARPLKDVGISAGFWDLEEVGLVGSREFVKSREKGGLPSVYINFDVYGAGDTIWLWTADENAQFAKNLARSAGNAKFGYLISTVYPPSDHRSFMVPGVETFSFSLGPAGEAASIVELLKGQGDPTKPPKVLTIIHTDNDRLELVDAAAVVRSLAVVEAAIGSLEK
jgi:aminopeptidase S